ncbi:BnaA02g34610D [Brassica napus]|uniref:BnaA02g34610D protein n=1 Tax=Brassica napus TaxID=3708 RepID=A0A078IQG6_BRANA|nr:BnaA02g34610D [Brassica napus]
MTLHRDIKGANLLVDASGVVKLADFGMAKHLTGQRADLSLKGSPFWMAPELMQAVMQRDSNPDLAFAVDIWSLGCTIIEMFTGKPPWSEFEGVDYVSRETNSSVLSTSPRNSDVSQLFNGMNITEPNSRRGKPNFKLDQVPRARNVTSSERSESWQQQQQQQHRSPDVIGTVTRLSPRSTLEAIRSPSPSQQPKASTDRRRIGVSSDHI